VVGADLRVPRSEIVPIGVVLGRGQRVHNFLFCAVSLWDLDRWFAPGSVLGWRLCLPHIPAMGVG
jgi:hypothetical protein